ncbi:MAG: 16S rRNA (guanine(966)-N(2))-methyltransferase RsmD [Thiomicrorhabdus chilensis]|uniref:16S rRNA (guanine(966)-N(2))-methyltransferase RsmD n=1 Tax=Thiomicrorhabdus chilensis TaxID=63656 RepID=UPI00299E2350|nr:16S rRNA (guanine(966)-N(2))-methyltransferase RsmD [Thiomicrorhabdus chilensis]MDX1347815.1 16S rRNA (guanine(966)-N(2))-methyltransferase RsmD [Thiomicrorhabdus chilensis]
MGRKTLKKTSHKKPLKNSRPAHSSIGEVRIIGGDWRGRKLPVRTAQGLRPTSDRVRETLFNWLQFEIPGARCLDVFAGSGALGFEALSRGAKQVTFLELDRANAQQLQANLSTLKAEPTEHAEVVLTDSLQWLAKPTEQPFDVIFLDPPFQQGLMQPAVDRLFDHGYVNNEQAWLYIEQEKELDWPQLPEGWVCFREKTTSQVRFGLWCRESLDGD